VRSDQEEAVKRRKITGAATQSRNAELEYVDWRGARGVQGVGDILMRLTMLVQMLSTCVFRVFQSTLISRKRT
jgi:uncharacterized protein YpbB